MPIVKDDEYVVNNRWYKSPEKILSNNYKINEAGKFKN